MPNASVIQRMRALPAQYLANELSVAEFERAVEQHVEALEFINLDLVHRARTMCSALIQAHFLDDDEEFGDPAAAMAALAEFHRFLDELPLAPA